MVTGEEDGSACVTGKAGGSRDTVNTWSPSRASSSSIEMVKQSESPFMLPVIKLMAISMAFGTVKSESVTVVRHWDKSPHYSMLIKR